jgi:cysteinyl-tRNA synthetase
MKLFNTLTRKKEMFVPARSGEVRMYTCGPTVHDFAHIGNFRTFVFEDVLKKYLKLRGHRVIQVMNITDIDDKTIAGAQRERTTLDDYTKRYIEAFFQDIDALRFDRAHRYPRATDHVPEMIRMIASLIERGYAYTNGGSVYFNISKFRPYGALSGREIHEESGFIDSDDYAEGDARDFALWKARKGDEPSWDAAFGNGRPGWHIECSAMSMKYLGESFDIHAGGVDNIFPHHENEIAQSESLTGGRFVKYWLHCEHLLVEGEKMSKSKGNFYTLRDLMDRGYSPRTIKFALSSSYYRHPFNFTLSGLEGCGATLQRIDDFRNRLLEVESVPGRGTIEEIVGKSENEFTAAMDDDLNSPRALAALFEMIRDVNRLLDADKGIGQSEKESLFRFIDRVDRVFDIFPFEEAVLPEKISRLIQKREEARDRKDYTTADRLRDEIATEGYILEDTAKGVKWKRRESVRRDM